MRAEGLLGSVEAITLQTGLAADRALGARGDELDDAALALKTLLAGIKSRRGAVLMLSKAREIADRNQEDAAVQALFLQVLDKVETAPQMAERWLSFLSRWPSDRIGIRFAARQLVRRGSVDEGIRLIEEQFDLSEFDEDSWLACAELLMLIEAHERSDQVFAATLEHRPMSNRTRIAYAKRLKARGLLQRALDVMDPVRATLRPGSKAFDMANELSRLHARYRDPFRKGGDVRVVLMVELIEELASKRSEPTFPGVGRICFITGTLGPGGAERQMSLLGQTLHEIATRGADIEVLGEHLSSDLWPEGDPGKHLSSVDFLLRSLDSKNGNGFFREGLHRAGVRVEEIETGGEWTAQRDASCPSHVDGVRDVLLSYLPVQVQWGIDNLYPILAGRHYDSVSIWQDGAVVYAAPAALLAGIKKVQIVFRGLPPSVRRYLLKPEYEPLYRALSAVPGVSFVANNSVAAREYESWIGLEPGRIEVLHNCIPAEEEREEPDEVALWQEFSTRTRSAEITVGSVARFESVKRPLDWIEAADRFRKTHDKSRFVMVGEGHLREEAQALADRLGLADRFLFVGHSAHPAFWYSKMDICMLLSRYEGLPNVLIEAQRLGVPVVATPAGGAGECFIHGETGYLLQSLERVDPSEAAACLKKLADQILGGQYWPKRARDFALSNFSVASCVRKFFEII